MKRRTFLKGIIGLALAGCAPVSTKTLKTLIAKKETEFQELPTDGWEKGTGWVFDDCYSDVAGNVAPAFNPGYSEMEVVGNFDFFAVGDTFSLDGDLYTCVEVKQKSLSTLRVRFSPYAPNSVTS